MRSRRGTSVLVTCGLMACLAAISVSDARAGMWMVNGKNIGSGVELNVGVVMEIEPFGEKKEKHIVIKTTIGSNTIEIQCGQATVPKATITLEALTRFINFSSCVTFINHIASPECNPINQPIVIGSSLTVVLHGGKSYLKSVGIEGVFGILKFSEEECVALTPTVKLTGTAWYEDANGELEVEKVTHLLTATSAPSALGGLFFGSNKAAYEGNINFRFNDAEHLGQAFSALAE